MKLQYGLSVCALTMAVTACSPSGSESEKESLSIPASLDFTLPSSQKLSSAEKNNFLRMINSKEKFLDIPAQLLTPESSQEKKKELNAQLKQAGSGARAAVKYMRQACKIQLPRYTGGSKEQKKNQLTSHPFKGSVSGKNCPVSIQHSGKMTIAMSNVKSKENEPFQGIVENKTNFVIDYKLKDKILAPVLGIKAAFETSQSRTVVQDEGMNAKMMYSSTANKTVDRIGLGLVTRKSQVDILFNVSSKKQIKDGSVVAHLWITFNKTTYVLSYRGRIQNGDPIITEAYLNGDEINPRVVPMSRETLAKLR